VQGFHHRGEFDPPEWANTLKNYYLHIRVEGRDKAKRRRYYRKIEKEKLRLAEMGVSQELLISVCRYLSTLNLSSENGLWNYCNIHPYSLIYLFKGESMKIKFDETTERYIAYFDIMGFTDMVYRHDHSYVSEIMNKVSNSVNYIKEMEEHIFQKAKQKKKSRIATDISKGIVQPVMFSDSVLFISRSNSIFDARKIIYVSALFLTEMFKFKIPIKGSLSYGVFTADFENSKFFGRPLVDAYHLACDTYFYGALLHHSFEKHVSENDIPYPEMILRRKQVPMKAGNISHSFIVFDFLNENDTPTSDLIPNFYSTVSGNVRKYVDNTLSVYDYKPIFDTEKS
jgi:hypothetical protein